jgi:hypothetical protein
MAVALAREEAAVISTTPNQKVPNDHTNACIALCNLSFLHRRPALAG